MSYANQKRAIRRAFDIVPHFMDYYLKRTIFLEESGCFFGNNTSCNCAVLPL